MKLGKHRQIAMKARRENCVEYNNYSNGTVLILVLMRVFFFSNVRHLVGHVNLMHRDPKAGEFGSIWLIRHLHYDSKMM
jgi:hypothetical protein